VGGLAAAAALLVFGCGGSAAVSSTESVATPTPQPANTERPDPVTAANPDSPSGSGRGEAPTDDTGPSQAEKERAAAAAEDAYSAYVDAINARDGKALCALLPADALRDLKPPVMRDGCAATLAASIGYEDPRGYPVWEGTTLTGIDSTSIGRDVTTARLTASIVTEFADRSQPSIESDIAYLELVGDRWRLAKPSSAIYRAIGRPEPPPDAISPP
jgi:hypothetical protein